MLLKRICLGAAVFAILGATMTAESAETPKYSSHPPLRTAPPAPARALIEGPTYYVHPTNGNDSNPGTKDAPWATISHSLRQLKPGDTLYLRGGVYYENLYCAISGRPEAPILVSSFPGEQAILDGGIREFTESPATAWEPLAGGAEGEYRSIKRYPNIRAALGWFGDSMIGLNTYFHAKDLRARSEVWNWQDWNRTKEIDADPLYCGPGIWYDEMTGHIHVRLAHTNLPIPDNYKGETDPRKLPLVIAPFRSVPLMLDRARHVKFQDIIIRGGGYNTVILDYAEQVEFDNVTVWCGTYGFRAARTGPLKVTRCGFYGSCPPWLFRSDTSKRAYPERPHRDITRLNTHAHWVIEAGREFSVFATPVNDNWEISYSEFTDSHDGPYFGGVSLRFHHNLVHNTKDDGIYLSQMYPRHLYAQRGAEIHIYQNYFARLLTALAFGGPETATKDKIFVYRNVFDLREPVPTGRPTSRDPTVSQSSGKVMGDHGSPPWPEMYIYHNTFVMAEKWRWGMGLMSAPAKERPRRVFNNIFVYLQGIPDAGYSPGPADDLQVDGSLCWDGRSEKPGDPFARFRSSRQFQESRQLYPHGFDANSFAADPKFVAFQADASVRNDFRLQAGSPAIDRGIELPADWPDPLRQSDAGKPDVGALPFGAEPLRVGRQAK